MTREEVTEILKELWRYEKTTKYSDAQIREAFEVAIEAVQKSRRGHWIDHPHEAGPCWEYSMYECSECHQWTRYDSDYCPNCGAEMYEE